MDTSSMIEAKKEYTTQLQQILSPRIYERFKFIFDGTIEVIKQELSMNHIQNQSVIKIFQKQLSSIKDWNESSIIEEYERIKSRSKCNYLDKLIKAVIVANMRILSTIQYGGRRKSKIQVHIPTPTHFIHKCYIECAKEIYKNPYIFDMSLNLSSKEKHQNLRDSLILIDNGIQSAIRQLLPIGDLLEQNFNSDVEDEEDDESVQSGVTKSSEESSVESSIQESSVEESSVDESSDDESSIDESSSEESSIESSKKKSIEEAVELMGGRSRSSSESSHVSSLSSNSASSESSKSLASKVGSALENHTIEDIDIHIGGDKETQSILGGIIAERAENFPSEPSHVPISEYVQQPQSIQQTSTAPVQSGGGGGGFLGALYNTFANSRNLNQNAVDVPAPVIQEKPVYGTSPVTEEVRQIVYTGNAVPKGFLTTTSTTQPVTQQQPVNQFGGGNQQQQVQQFPLSQSIYPKQTPQYGGNPVIIKKHRSGSSIISNKLSLKEQKLQQQQQQYQQKKVQESSNISVKSRSYSSESEGSFHF